MKIVLDEVDYTVRQLSVEELSEGLIENMKVGYMADAYEVAQLLVGKEKIEFLKSVSKDMPKKEELYLQVEDYVQSLDGIEYILRSSVEPSLEFKAHRIEEYLPMINAALGIEGTPEAVEETETQKNPVKEG